VGHWYPGLERTFADLLKQAPEQVDSILAKNAHCKPQEPKRKRDEVLGSFIRSLKQSRNWRQEGN
jgi:hypothetical protein